MCIFRIEFSDYERFKRLFLKLKIMTENAPQVFTLKINGRDEELNCRTICKLSKKIKELVNDSEYSAVIDREISEKTVESFLAAARGEQFKLTPEIAPELLYLANEWQIDSLESFVSKYMKAKGLNTEIELPNVDYLGQLLSQADDHLASDFLFRQVGKRLNNYFSDDRLLDLNVESLFQVILNAELSENPIDQDKYRDFLLKMFDYNIYTAVPLILRLNFSKLLPAQDNIIYETPEVHDQNINYFVILAVSATRNTSEKQRVRLVEAIQNCIQNLQSDLRKQRHDDARNLHEEHKQRVDHLKQIIAEQKRQIDTIREYREDQMKRHEEENELFNRQIKELREQMAKEKKELIRRAEAIQQLKDDVKEEIESDAHGVKDHIVRELKKEGKVINTRPETLRNNCEEPLANLHNNFDEMKNTIDKLDDRVNKIIADLRDKQTILAAKMVRDFMRFDKFVRRTTKRFKLFSDMDIWGLEPDEVKNSEQNLTQIERRLDKICPIRHGVTQQ